MIDRDYKVKFITSKNSFIFLSAKDLRRFDQDLLIRISYGVCKTAYFTLGPPLNSLKEGELALCSVLAKELGIIKGDTVSLSSSPNYSSIRKLNIIPSSKDDYEVLALLAENIQNTLLHQVRIVHNQQKLVIWISNSLRVIVDVEGILPISPGKLEQMTEISIVEPNEHNSNDKIPCEMKKRNSIGLKDNPLHKYNKTYTICRLHPVEDLKELINKHLDNNYLEQPFNIFVSRTKLPLDLPENFDSVETVILVKLKLIRYEHEGPEISDIIARLFMVEDICDFKFVNTSIVFANKCIFDHLNAKFGAKVILDLLKEIPKPVKLIEIMTKSAYYSKADELVRNYLIYNCQQGPFLINRDVILMEPNGCKFLLKFDADTLYCLIDRSFMRLCKFSLHNTELVLDKDKDEKKEPPLNIYLECSNYNKILEDTIRCAQMKLDNDGTDSSNVLWVGKPGSGKTGLASHLSKTISQTPHRVHVELLTCKKLKGKNIDSLLKILNSTFVRLIYFQPSLLILDDLHVICEKVIEGEAPTQENLHFNKVSEMLADFLENCTRLNNICLLATAESANKLNQNVFCSRGKHLFKNVFNIDDLNQNDRTGVMKYLFKMKDVECSSIDYEKLSLKTEGFVIQDLIDYVDKIIFEAYKDHICDDNFKITTKHCEEALKNTSSLSLREVQLHSPGERDFSDVGGLEDIKKMLIECMLWPAQYPSIFGKAPLRLQSGVLLYGPPGTGKTILAGAAAKQCNLRLISIKGPELLSKYIGASEQAVRDVFQKAQSAKPCILFFDEFDSLAPRRGHDNTGVTDRVVNQFLTQLDGVESLNGVCVLAATSRPDLLDPALLRPGRLDRQILCPMPDRDSRLAILKVLSKAVVLSKDVNLEKVADDTVGYSGADLQAVLYTAQLSSVEYLLEANNINVTNKETLITQSHIEGAIRTTRPSLTRDEKLRYERIYSKFQGKGDILDIQSGKQKATLA